MQESGSLRRNERAMRVLRSKYDDGFPEIAEGYARRGLSDADIAKNLGISLDAYYRYQKLYSEFYEAIRRGKRPAKHYSRKCTIKDALDLNMTRLRKK